MPSILAVHCTSRERERERERERQRERQRERERERERDRVQSAECRVQNTEYREILEESSKRGNIRSDSGSDNN